MRLIEKKLGHFSEKDYRIFAIRFLSSSLSRRDEFPISSVYYVYMYLRIWSKDPQHEYLNDLDRVPMQIRNRFSSLLFFFHTRVASISELIRARYVFLPLSHNTHFFLFFFVLNRFSFVIINTMVFVVVVAEAAGVDQPTSWVRKFAFFYVSISKSVVCNKKIESNQ